MTLPPGVAELQREFTLVAQSRAKAVPRVLDLYRSKDGSLAVQAGRGAAVRVFANFMGCSLTVCIFSRGPLRSISAVFVGVFALATMVALVQARNIREALTRAEVTRGHLPFVAVRALQHILHAVPLQDVELTPEDVKTVRHLIAATDSDDRNLAALAQL